MGTFDGTRRFRVVRQIGAGGMGVVYEAHDVERDERVALKTLPTLDLDPDALFRFKREFRALHGIEHPNLVRLGELVEHEGTWFFTMELVDGVDFLSHVWSDDWRALSRSSVGALTVRDGKLVVVEPDDVAMPEIIYDEPRLRAALRQLALAIAAVHEAGKVHRDVKPSNVCITRDGRVVLLDFGLVTGVARGDRSTVAGICGTPQYMAPEQVLLADVGPPADWYALGVLLYEALTTHLPVDGTPLEIMKEKLAKVPPAPSAIGRHVPRDLDQLCLALLRVDPKTRPTGSEVLARLDGVRGPSVAPTVPPEVRPSAVPLVGRRAEHEALRAAWAHCRSERRIATVLVDGGSGSGKTALLRAFQRGVQGADPRALVLEGRAYEHESIPFNAFDHVIDSLARFLRALRPDEAAELLPRDAWMLPRLFPVLGRVPAIARLTRALHLALDAAELRTRCFATFSELLARIAERRSLLVVLDDLQWAGRDSAMLLDAIVRSPSPPPMLLVLATRDAKVVDPHAAGDDAARSWAPDGLVRVHLGPLPLDDARSFAAELVERAGIHGLDPGAVAEEAEGHPLFIQELVRYAAGHPSRTSDRPRLDEAIRARAHAMDAHAQRLLELAAVAGGPIRRDVLAGAAQLDSQSMAKRLSSLEKAHLVRSDATSLVDWVEPFHNRIREATLAELDPARLRECHARLAEAYDQAPERDLARLTRHLVGAGERARGAETARLAAAEAEQGLAFDRAAELYRLALELREGAPAQSLRASLARALASAGRSLEAADAYVAAGLSAEGASAVELAGLAAQQYVRGGQFDRGMTLAREALQKIGVRVPETPRSAIVRTAWLRLVAWMRGTRVRVRAADAVSAEDAQRVDLLHDFAMVTSGADAVLGTWLTTRALLEAQRVGEPGRLARALSSEGAWLAGGAGAWTPRIERLMVLARDLEPRGNIGGGWVDIGTGTVDFSAARFPLALDRLSAAYATFAERPGRQFEVAMIQALVELTLFAMGRVAELRELAATRLRVAIDAGDRYHAAFHRLGPGNAAMWLAPDQPARALEEARAGHASWGRSRFDLIAYFAFASRVEIALYAGRPQEAWDEVERTWPLFARSMVAFIGFIRVGAHDLRGRAALALAGVAPSRRGALLGETERAARALSARRSPTGPERARLLRAGSHALAGDSRGEQHELESAIAGFDALAMGAHAAVARRRLGELVAGDAGKALVERADGWLRAQRIVRPELWARMLAPGRAPDANA